MKSTSHPQKLLILKDEKGQAIRYVQTQQSQLSVVQNIRTKRIEFRDSLNPEQDVADSTDYIVLQELNLDRRRGPIALKNIGSLVMADNPELVPLDPEPMQDNDPQIRPFIQWSSGTHGAILSLLILLAFIIKDKPKSLSINKDSLVTIQLDTLENKSIQNQARATQPSIQPKTPLKSRQAMHVVPRIDKRKSLLVQKQATSSKRYRGNQGPSNGPTQFQRLGSLGAISNAIKGSRSGMGSGLRGANGGTGGVGRGAGTGRGNGTMGHGHDSGGGYEQALYGRGLIAGQVGGGGGGFGSGWGEGTRGSGGYGTKGKGGGHEGFGNSKVGSGASQFSYPVQDEAVVEGGLDREAVDLVVTRNLGQIIYCYELGLQEKSSLRGRVLIDFTINGKGRVSSCSVSSSSLRSSRVENCMISKIKNWKFPQPVGGVSVDVNYPFALQRVSQN